MIKNIQLIFIFSIQLIYTSYIFSQNSWVVQTSGTNESLWTVDFVDENTGFISGSNGLILKTTNGGDIWTSSYAGVSDLIGIDFINQQTGWVSGHFGTIYKSTNGGTNWFRQISNTNVNLFFVEFVNANTGYISSDAGVIRTIDGGESWNYSFHSGVPVYSVYFLNDNYGWFGDNLGNQFLTSNGASTWTYSQNVAGAGNIAYNFINQSTGWSVGYNNTIIKTTNGGYNWINQSSGLSASTLLRDIEFVNNSSDTGWAVGFNNSLIKTTNGGVNWGRKATPVSGEFSSVEFINNMTGWIVGFSGVILKTTNGGLTDINSSENTVPDRFNLSQNFPNPFNPSTKIKYYLPESGYVSLKVFDRLGKEVAVLVNGSVSAGTYEINFDASQLASGNYFYKLKAGDYVITKKMILIK